MTIADRLRAELANDAELNKYKKIYLDRCIKYIPLWGKMDFLYGSHIGKFSDTAFPERFHNEIVIFFRSNGFNVSEKVNGYGVKYILITL